MDKFAELLFLSEIEFQAQQSITANNQIDDNLRNKDVRAVFAALDDLIDHAARISLILWPSTRNITPEAKKRGQHLRGVFGLADKHTLKDRRLRDSLVHFDERLDRWVAEKPFDYYGRHIGHLISSSSRIIRRISSATSTQKRPGMRSE